MQINPKYVDKNIYETLERIQSYDLHMKRLTNLKQQLEVSKVKGVQADPEYKHLRSTVAHNKLKSHEEREKMRIVEIKKSNQVLLDRLLEISKGKTSQTNQKNLKVPRCASKSLNYFHKKKEAERIDREN